MGDRDIREHPGHGPEAPVKWLLHLAWQAIFHSSSAVCVLALAIAVTACQIVPHLGEIWGTWNTVYVSVFNAGDPPLIESVELVSCPAALIEETRTLDADSDPGSFATDIRQLALVPVGGSEIVAVDFSDVVFDPDRRYFLQPVYRHGHHQNRIFPTYNSREVTSIIDPQGFHLSMRPKLLFVLVALLIGALFSGYMFWSNRKHSRTSGSSQAGATDPAQHQP